MEKDGGALTYCFFTRLHTQSLQYPIPRPSSLLKEYICYSSPLNVQRACGQQVIFSFLRSWQPGRAARLVAFSSEGLGTDGRVAERRVALIVNDRNDGRRTNEFKQNDSGGKERVDINYLESSSPYQYLFLVFKLSVRV